MLPAIVGREGDAFTDFVVGIGIDPNDSDDVIREGAKRALVAGFHPCPMPDQQDGDRHSWIIYDEFFWWRRE